MDRQTISVYNQHQVNSAFHPSGVSKSWTGLYPYGWWRCVALRWVFHKQLYAPFNPFNLLTILNSLSLAFIHIDKWLPLGTKWEKQTKTTCVTCRQRVPKQRQYWASVTATSYPASDATVGTRQQSPIILPCRPYNTITLLCHIHTHTLTHTMSPSFCAMCE